MAVDVVAGTIADSLQLKGISPAQRKHQGCEPHNTSMLATTNTFVVAVRVSLRSASTSRKLCWEIAVASVVKNQAIGPAILWPPTR